MRGVMVVLGQIFLALLVTGAAFPLVLYSVPQVRSDAVGPYAVIGLAAVFFVLLRLIWPREKSEK